MAPSAGRGSPKYFDVVAAAQHLIGENGYEKTSVRQIADQAHLALGTLYSYFPEGKVAILTAALDERVEHLASALDRVDRNDPVEAFLTRVATLNIEIVEDPFLRRLFADLDRIGEPRLRECGRTVIDTFGDRAHAELLRLNELGLIRCEDPEAVITLIRVSTTGWISAQSLRACHAVEHHRLVHVLIDALRATMTAHR